jgi:hypothetical protein
MTRSATAAAGLLLVATPLYGATLNVKTASELQAALITATCGDTIVVAQGEYVGEFVAPAKQCQGVILVRGAVLLPDGKRAAPADAVLMPRLRSGTPGAAFSMYATSGWTLRSLSFAANLDGRGTLIAMQDASKIVLDQLVIDVEESVGQRRCVLANGEDITVQNSYIDGCRDPDRQDSQAIASWDGRGPYTFRNNYLSAASENVMFGGADSRSEDRVPSNITIEENDFRKRDAWRGTLPDGSPIRVGVKNLLEFKVGRDVVVRKNSFSGSWGPDEGGAQDGYCLVITTANQDGTAPWSEIRNVLVEQNHFSDCYNGVNVLGTGYLQPSGRTTNVAVQNNLWTDIRGLFLKVGGEVGRLVFDHNTVDNAWSFAVAYRGDVWPAGGVKRPAAFAVEDFVFTNNIVRHGEYGFIGEDCAIGVACLQAMTKAFTWTANALAGTYGAPYPAGTMALPEPEHRKQFVDYGSNYTLTAASVYRKVGTGGSDLGVTTPVTPPEPTCPAPLRLRVSAWPSLVSGKQTSSRWTPSGSWPTGSEALISFSFTGARSTSATLTIGPCTVIERRP